MKNIHLLPTDKPSSYVTNYMEKIMQWQNIYITSAEEIKEGDWLFSSKTNNIFKADSIEYLESHNMIEDFDKSFYINSKYSKKIILTTDQSLDGVQAIDDEFLEWFVKNPSCESVEVAKEPLIIKGEADYFNYDNGTKLNTNVGKYQIIIPQEEPKFVTVEEAAEMHLNSGKIPNDYKSFIEGAKWQQENSYSQEDMKNAFKVGFSIGYGSDVHAIDEKNRTCDEWFEQFKKK
jgi:hypothetical protein